MADENLTPNTITIERALYSVYHDAEKRHYEYCYKPETCVMCMSLAKLIQMFPISLNLGEYDAEDL